MVVSAAVGYLLSWRKCHPPRLLRKRGDQRCSESVSFSGSGFLERTKTVCSFHSCTWHNLSSTLLEVAAEPFTAPAGVLPSWLRWRCWARYKHDGCTCCYVPCLELRMFHIWAIMNVDVSSNFICRLKKSLRGSIVLPRQVRQSRALMYVSWKGERSVGSTG